MFTKRHLVLVTSSITALVVLAACGSTSTPAAQGGSGSNTSNAPTASGAAPTDEEQPLDPSALVIYNAQHENLTQAWADEFSKENGGVKVQLRNGSDLEMANQIVAEGADSPADVFITENSPGMNLVEQAGLFAPVDPGTTSQIPAQYSPSTGKWVGVAARSTVFVYNTSKLTQAQLPKSLIDLADPAWKGRWAASPSGADFQAIISALYELKGADATKTWLTAMKNDAAIYKGNSTVMKAVNAGEVDGGVIYHYYWYGDQAKTKENSSNTALHFFGNQDPGAFVSVSGAGVLASSDKKELAQKFLKFLTSKKGQEIVANNVLEYPLADITSETNKALKPLSSLEAPVVDPASLNSVAVTDLMTEVGLL
ncbi:iron ABC transporter substrate-binding protein [Nakamurella antarctica]|uniref:Iron ABC transporter substrate-binding protein n=1 Tax=Nakamurella antarctica TaxID=1902245 RepID=A0A3G8ZNB1_9ACTN|nr:iron ABC transporter substrate-binding protein [Nakamurella antarctica]AZI58789.1 iron ABC transporter substrate-binding protein [Nakamurella antarctica]